MNGCIKGLLDHSVLPTERSVLFDSYDKNVRIIRQIPNILKQIMVYQNEALLSLNK